MREIFPSFGRIRWAMQSVFHILPITFQSSNLARHNLSDVWCVVPRRPRLTIGGSYHGKQKREMPDTQPRLDAGNSSDAKSIVLLTERCYYWECFLRSFLLVLHLISFILNFRTVIEFLMKDKVFFGIVTLGIWLGSGLVNTVISVWITADYEEPHLNRDHENRVASSKFEQIVKYLLQWTKFVVLQLALPQRHLQSLAYTCKAYKIQEGKKIKTQSRSNNGRAKRRRDKNLTAQHNRMLKEHRNIASLDLVNCCFKTAPLFILRVALQLNENDPISPLGTYLLFNPPRPMRIFEDPRPIGFCNMLFDGILLFVLRLTSATFLLDSVQEIKLCRCSLSDMWVRIIVWCVDIVTCGLSMRSMHTTSRSTTTTRIELGMVPSLLVCIWHTGTIGSRLMIVTVGASMWPEETLEVCFYLWISWMVWLYCTEDARKAFCLEKTDIFREVFCSSVVALVYLSTFVNLRRGSTFCRQSVYIIVNSIINIICVYIIRSYTTRSESHALIAIYIIILILYLVGNIAMICFYTQQHPTWHFKTCVNSFCESLTNFFRLPASDRTDAADQPVSSQDTKSDADYTPLAIPAFDKLFWRFDCVFNKLLDWIGPIPMHRSILKEVVVLGQNNTPVGSSGSGSEHD